MRIDAGTLVVTLLTNSSAFKEGLADAEKKVDSWSARTTTWVKEHKLAIAGAITAVGLFGITAVKAYGESEEAVLRLSQSVGGPAAKALASYAGELQRTTTYTDEAIVGIQAQLAQYGVLPGSIKSATAAIVDYAARTGQDLPSATGIFISALKGQDRELKAYGLQLKDGATRSENLAKVTQFMTQTFGGAASQMAGTTLGSVQNLTNRMQELQEKIGGQLVPVVSTWVGWLDKAVAALEKLSGASRNDLSVRDMQLQQLERQKNMMMQALQGHAEYRNQLILEMGTQAQSDAFLAKRLVLTQNTINLLKQKTVAEKETGDAALAATGVAMSAEEAANQVHRTGVGERIKQAQQEAFAHNEFMRQRIQEAQTEARLRTEYTSTMFDAMSKLAGTWTDFSIKSAQMVTDAFGRGAADMILDGKKFSDVMQDLWKDMAREFIAQVARMIAKWLAFQALRAAGGGGFGGFWATGGVIREPSVVTGLYSGVQHIAGENGPEAVVPMGKDVNGPMSGDTAAAPMPNITVQFNVSGHFVEASPSKWQEITRSVVIPELRRWAMSHPGELLNRRRGSS